MTIGIFLRCRFIGVCTVLPGAIPPIHRTLTSYVIRGKIQVTQFRGARIRVTEEDSGRGATVRRTFWTLGMALIGLFLALKGQDVKVNVTEVVIGGIWGAAIGYGLGSIFDQRRPRRRLIIYWAATLALVALFFGPIVPVSSFFLRQTVAGVLGALAGAIVGVVQLKLAQRESRASEMRPSV